MMAPRRSDPHDLGKTVIWVRDIGVAVVALLILVTQVLQWLGMRQTSPAEAVQQLSRQLQRSDSLSREGITSLERATRVNSYSICLLSRRPQNECEDIMFSDGLPQRPTR